MGLTGLGSVHKLFGFQVLRFQMTFSGGRGITRVQLGVGAVVVRFGIIGSVAAISLALGPVDRARAGWTCISLHPPSGSSGSFASNTTATHQVGTAYVGGREHACLWSGTAGSWVDLHPAGLLDSYANVNFGSLQAGSVVFDSPGPPPPQGYVYHAALWSGTASSVVDLNPAGAIGSVVWGMSSTQQVGRADFAGGVSRASLWQGTAASWVDLTPAGFSSSQAVDASGSEQVGTVLFGSFQHAVRWRGTAQSWVDLHPIGALSSTAWGTSGTQQVGQANFGGGVAHAGLWSGTPGSWVDLHPTGMSSSAAFGVSGPYQVGTATSGTATYASFWSGTAASWVNLATYLPDGPGAWGDAQSTDVWTEGSRIYVVGYGSSFTTGRNEALLWIYEPDTLPGDMNCDGFVGVGDIGGFVLALTNPAQYAALFPACDIYSGDVNDDSFVSVADIGPFVQLLAGG